MQICCLTCISFGRDQQRIRIRRQRFDYNHRKTVFDSAKWELMKIQHKGTQQKSNVNDADADVDASADAFCATLPKQKASATKLKIDSILTIFNQRSQNLQTFHHLRESMHMIWFGLVWFFFHHFLAAHLSRMRTFLGRMVWCSSCKRSIFAGSMHTA